MRASKALNKRMKLIQELLGILESQDEAAALAKWQEDVKAANPSIASKLKFKPRIEQGKDLISAEVSGQDRCYGVFDRDTCKGTVLGD